jgi:hypothetical protein
MQEGAPRGQLGRWRRSVWEGGACRRVPRPGAWLPSGGGPRGAEQRAAPEAACQQMLRRRLVESRTWR